MDGENWYGQDNSGIWVRSYWQNYQNEFTDFRLVSSGEGRRVVYISSRDAAGNIGYGHAEIYITKEVIRETSPVATNPGSSGLTGSSVV